MPCFHDHTAGVGWGVDSTAGSLQWPDFTAAVTWPLHSKQALPSQPLRMGFFLANTHKQRQFKKSSSVCVLASHRARLHQALSPALVSSTQGREQPPPRPSCSSPLLFHHWQGPFMPLPSPQSHAPCVSPEPLPGDSASGHHLSLL